MRVGRVFRAACHGVAEREGGRLEPDRRFADCNRANRVREEWPAKRVAPAAQNRRTFGRLALLMPDSARGAVKLAGDLVANVRTQRVGPIWPKSESRLNGREDCGPPGAVGDLSDNLGPGGRGPANRP